AATSTLATGGTASVSIEFNGEQYTLKLAASSTTAATADFTAANLANVLKGSAVGIQNLTATLTKGTATVSKIDGLSFSGSSSGTFVVSTLSSGDTISISGTEYAYAPPTPAVQGQLTLDFGSGLLAGQSYTYLQKTVIATKDLTGEEVAEAFAFGDETSSGVDGAVVLGKWQLTSAGGSTGSSAGIDPSKVLFDISGSSLILMEQTPGSGKGLLVDVLTTTPMLTGTGTLAVNTSKVSGNTTQQGEKNGEIVADSYVTFAGIGTGSAGSGADAGTVTAIKATTNALDTITNFDISNDKLLLKGVDGDALGFSIAGSFTLSTSTIYVDTAGSTLNARTDAGIISFGVTAGSGAATGADAITLDQKLYVAVDNIASGSAVGFEHGGDTYVVVGGTNTNSTTDDLVIKLAGVTGVTDITSILA
ncbi:MAG: hypothetical protein K2N70_03285, partial [Helicobacter sp.]|nr:hypothetical protein [Helicobacter sp.]